MTDWMPKAAAMADQLVAAGKLRSPEWISALRSVPRHGFAPTFFEQDEVTGQWREIAAAAGPGLDKIYSNIGLYTKLSRSGLPLSSTSQPSLMARMLEALDLADHHRVLEVGTGTGYNAALLCHRLGDGQVYSVDVDVELVELARARLAACGYHPTVVAADGAGGLAEHAPYDRLIATCSVPSVPWAWVDQLVPGGLALVDVKRSITAGNLVLLRRDGQRAEGRFDRAWAGFMAMRRPGDTEVARPERERSTVTPRPSVIGFVRPWEHTVAWFLASLALPADVGYGTAGEASRAVGDVFLYARDGSWTEVAGEPDNDGRHQVWSGGSCDLWAAVEDGYRTWQRLGEPSWERFGLTVHRNRQTLWLDHPGGDQRWELPVAT